MEQFVIIMNDYKEYWYNNVNYLKIKTNKGWIRFVKLMVFQ